MKGVANIVAAWVAAALMMAMIVIKLLPLIVV
jgi:hypothetical protein